jgi:hypothetical protein
MPRRAYTVNEANALIPALERVLSDIRQLREIIRQRTDKLQVLDVLWGGKVAAPANPDHGEYIEQRGEIARAAAAIERIVDGEIMTRGLRFPVGGLDHGLIDFPTTLDGRWVYLCWRSSEPTIVAWHEVDGGFAGRRELTVEYAARMGLTNDAALPDDSMLDF